MTTQARHSRGFSLIELMVVVVILGALAAIALPSYQNSVVNSRRGTAAACLTELSQFMERYYTTNLSYANAVLPQTACRNDLAQFYTFAFVAAPDATTYSIRATAIGAQAARDNRCGNLTVNQIGTRTLSVAGATPAQCW